MNQTHNGTAIFQWYRDTISQMQNKFIVADQGSVVDVTIFFIFMQFRQKMLPKIDWCIPHLVLVPLSGSATGGPFYRYFTGTQK